MNRSDISSSVFIVVGVFLIIIATALVLIVPKLNPTTTLQAGDGVFEANIAYTQSGREKGLGGTESLEDDKALILAFPSDDKWGIWMKDMKYPIDIIWLDSDRKIVHIVKNASSDNPTDIFSPPVNARYVIEFVAGTVDAQNIKPGRAAVFDIDENEIK